MKISDRGLQLIKYFEGFSGKAYKCPAGIWTIGYGTTQYPNDDTVKPDDICTKSQATEWLAHDCKTDEKAVTAMVKVPLSQNQYDALVCFSYNVGIGALRSSTLLKLLNSGDYSGAALQFGRWNKGGGIVLPGLTKRRAEEAALFSEV